MQVITKNGGENVAPNNAEIINSGEGAEATIAAMDEWQRLEIGRKTYNFVQRLMRNPEYREMIKARAAEIRAAGS